MTILPSKCKIVSRTLPCDAERLLDALDVDGLAHVRTHGRRVRLGRRGGGRSALVGGGHGAVRGRHGGRTVELGAPLVRRHL